MSLMNLAGDLNGGPPAGPQVRGMAKHCMRLQVCRATRNGLGNVFVVGFVDGLATADNLGESGPVPRLWR